MERERRRGKGAGKIRESELRERKERFAGKGRVKQRTRGERARQRPERFRDKHRSQIQAGSKRYVLAQIPADRRLCLSLAARSIGRCGG